MESQKQQLTKKQLVERRMDRLVNAALWHLVKIAALCAQIDGEMVFIMRLALGVSEQTDEALGAISTDKITKCREVLNAICAHMSSLKVIVNNRRY